MDRGEIDSEVGWFGFKHPAALILVLALVAYGSALAAREADWFSAGRALGASAPAAAIVVGFGIAYASTGWWGRAGIFGLAREAQTVAMVGLYFFAAVATLAGHILLAGLPPPEAELCLPVPTLETRWGTLLGECLDPRPRLELVALTVTAYLVLAAVPVAAALVRPPRPIPEVTPPPVSVTRRVLARLADAVVVTVFTLSVVVGHAWGVEALGIPFGIARAGMVAVPLIVVYLYEAGVLTGGVTLGKRLMGTRLVTSTGGSLTGWRRWARPLVPLAVFSGVLDLAVLVVTEQARPQWVLVRVGVLMVMLVLLFAQADRRALHDLFAGTRVVRAGWESGPQDVQSVGTLPLTFPLPSLRGRPGDPFAEDLLDRRYHVEAVCRVLGRTGGSPLVILDGHWGSGKTAFVEMCRAHLEGIKVRTVVYNAWQAGYTTDPLLDLTAAVANSWPEDSGLVGAARRVSTLRGWVDDQAAVNVELAMRGGHAVERLRNKLQQLVEDAGGRLVVLVDELDRCRPEFAVGTLEAARNVLSVEGVSVLVAAARDELRCAVEGLYGPGFGAERYLRRFADLVTPLVAPTPEGAAAFLDAVAASYGLGATSDRGGSSYVLLTVGFGVEGWGLRDIQQVAGVVAVALQAPPPREYPPGLWEGSVAAMALLRQGDRRTYYDVISGSGGVFDAVAAARSWLGPLPGVLDVRARWARNRFLAMLVNINSWDDWRRESAAEFIARYMEATGSSADEADDVRRELRRALDPRVGVDFVRVAGQAVGRAIEWIAPAVEDGDV